MHQMKILIAADSFKDALPARQVCHALMLGVKAAIPDAEIRCCPLADGGEGTLEVLTDTLKLRNIRASVYDPLLRLKEAKFGYSNKKKTALIEMAQTAGLQLLLPEERNPLLTSTFGMGLQIIDAVNMGAREIILAIGGSATNDAGAGMAAVLGWQFLDKNNENILPCGEALGRINRIIPPVNPVAANFTVICDVKNPLLGPNGATHVYGRQKGADNQMITQLEAGMQHFAALVKTVVPGADPDFPGAGAAGGLGFGAMTFLNAQLRSGIDLVLDLSGFEKHLEWADLLITGEGKIDGQTSHGKLIQGLCQRAAGFEVPVIAFCGKLEADEKTIAEIGLKAAYSINEPGKTLPEMLTGTAENLEKTARQIFKNSV